MPLPKEVVAIQERMKQAQDALLDFVESKAEREPGRYNALLGNLIRTTQEYLDRITSLGKDLGH